MAARGSNKRAVVPVEGGTGAATRTGSTRHGLSRSALGRVLNLVDCIAPPPGVGQWSGLLEGGTWVTTGAALLGGARSLVGATDQTPVSSLLARVAAQGERAEAVSLPFFWLHGWCSYCTTPATVMWPL